MSQNQQASGSSLPTQTVPNPKGTGNVSAISLRSGKATQSKKQAAKAQDNEILDTFRKVEVNIPLLDAIQQISRYAKFLKEFCTNKRRLKGDERVSSLGLGPLRATGIVVQLANRSSVHRSGVVEDILVRVNHMIFSADFYVLGMEGETPSSTIILDRPFMKTARTKIDVHVGAVFFALVGCGLVYGVFNLQGAFLLSLRATFMLIFVVLGCCTVKELRHHQDTFLVAVLSLCSNCTACAEIALCCSDFNHALNDDLHSGSALKLNSELPVEIIDDSVSENLIAGIYVNVFSAELAPTRLLPSTEQLPKLEMKVLHDHLKYAYLEENEQLPVIVAKNLLPEQEVDYPLLFGNY
ncbi:uncharacterized protein LOC133306079 [Gastrolobium bilobum]|uniref:uncharacterized protein LOC133306079 n=1 Tax=Gastrolobium bilobum TaxID=150636 RepID=UPI002AB28B9F|nr:uncharacterized protein LOC133306079 [Gastrolobium bilobum]